MESKNELKLNASKNCSNCSNRTIKSDFPYACKLNDRYTGMLVTCENWKEKKET